LSIYGNLIPNNTTRDLGDTTYEWQNLYIKAIKLGNAQEGNIDISSGDIRFQVDNGAGALATALSIQDGASRKLDVHAVIDLNGNNLSDVLAMGMLIGSDPVGATDTAHIYAKDDAGSAEVFVRDEAGNITKISPHNKQGEWEFHSYNSKTGKTFKVNMEHMIRKLEEITGETFIE
jgi:hypothetical protein